MHTNTNHEPSSMIDPEIALTLQKAKDFLLCYFADALSEEEIRSQLRQALKFNPLMLHEGMHAIEKLLSTQLPPQTLCDLVLWSANVVLEPPNDENARIWLQKSSQMVQFILDAY
ncbi:MAG: hypothetical protein AAGF95_03045 [Chloroflexota bacterium]